MKKQILIVLGGLFLCGCASEKSPLLTGNAKDWRDHPTADLVAVCGKPARILNQSNSEIWQYVKEWDAVVPKGSRASFQMQGFSGNSSSAIGGGGGFESHDQYAAHYVRTDNFAVKGGIIKEWYGEIDENDRVVWKGH